MTPTIAIVGMACQYPDARSPIELWENVLAQRRAFRKLPPERLNLTDYLSADRSAPDCTYSTEAALIEGYEFDRVAFRVAGSTFRSADLTHWLALDVATQALADAGFPDGDRLPRDTTGIVLGNTLTGEFSRANTMRLRWPYVRRIVEATLMQQNWLPEQRWQFLKNLEALYKEPFPAINEETLAGNLSNTIAGRICNHFDFKGGGYTVDGACSSSLLAVATVCSALVTGDLDVAIAGGVDLSLDPFELVGFAKAGALADEEMHIYDTRSSGFLPGEGCGFVVLMRYEDAVARDCRIYATIRGWGISSDGHGGITRPEVEGQLLALHHAYRRASFGIETVSLFEGHGTGTSIGDATELRSLSRARREAAPQAPPAIIGSIKANIGHTKAAAGVAGLIKATMALHNQILPPTTGCDQPHPILTDEKPALQVLNKGQSWSPDLPLRAGVSAMGFGGINTHIVLERTATERRQNLTHQEQVFLASAQDAELILMSARDTNDLHKQVEHLLTLSPRLSRAEVADLATELQRRLDIRDNAPIRASIVADTPLNFTNRLEILKSWLSEAAMTRLDSRLGIFLSTGINLPRIGFLFPGQGSPLYLNGGAWCRRFEFVQELYTLANLSQINDNNTTAIAQPTIVTASIAALYTLEKLGITGNIAVGHSLGELTALHWGGVFDTKTVLRIATVRGKAMAELSSPSGAMVSVRASQQELTGLLSDRSVVIAGLNSPQQTVISGETKVVDTIVDRATALGFKTFKLPVSHAFHSPLVASSGEQLAEHLKKEHFQPLQKTVVSTVTGSPISSNEDLPSLLIRQITSPVRFMEAVTKAAEGVDLFIEVGPGQVLSGLVSEFLNVPVVAIDAGGFSLSGLLKAVGAAFALGAPVNHKELFAGRFTRAFHLEWRPQFFANPCELAPVSKPIPEQKSSTAERQKGNKGSYPPSLMPKQQSPLELVRQLVAERAELPTTAVKDDSRLLSELHLNSITVAQLVVEASRCLNLPPPSAPTDYANASVGAIAQALEELLHAGASRIVETEKRSLSGVDSWIRAFTVELVERPLPRYQFSASIKEKGCWQIIAPTEYLLAKLLQKAFEHYDGGGIILCLPPEESDECYINLLLQGARAVLAAKEATHFVLIQHNMVGTAFARTLYQEVPNLTTCVINIPVDRPETIEWILAEVRAAVGYSEAHYDAFGYRREPIMRFLPMHKEPAELTLTSNDVLLVTGGGKGIAAECALSLAREIGVRLVLLGRSQPENDIELATNLDRMTASGIQLRYIAADVSNPEAVRVAVSKAEIEFGPITAILHGAGVNVPQLLTSLDEAAFFSTLAPKVQGVRNLLSAINPEHLRLFITFGSIIARTGLRGEAHYALANEWLACLLEKFQAQHPKCRCLNIEWSIWSGVGMGERLGRIDILMQQGITPISPDVGISVLRRLLAQSLPATSIIVTGRFGKLLTLKVEQPELPFLRFLEYKRVYYPGVELIVDAELSADSDPYLNEHIFQGERLFPAVMAMEAIAQVVMALTHSIQPPIFKDVKFSQPVVVPDGLPMKIRLAALIRESEEIEVVLRSEQTSFMVNHFQATCVINQLPLKTYKRQISSDRADVSLNPERELYGSILFHSGRFRRLQGYRHLTATECFAEIAPDSGTPWFSRYLPEKLVLGDPAARDAAIHALQACIPHATILPVGVDRLISSVMHTSPARFVHARERAQLDNIFIYDLQVLGADGVVLEQWDGLRLQVVNQTVSQNSLAETLLGPYMERRIREFVTTADITVVVDKDPTVEHRVRSDRAIRQALGSLDVPVWRRPDGKPEAIGSQAVSAAHAGDITLAVAGSEPVGCDIESVVSRSVDLWKGLLGVERFALAEVIAQQVGEDRNTAATRIWAASECLRKAGAMVDAPLVLVLSTADGWAVLASGHLTITTLVASVQKVNNQLVLAVLLRSNHASL
ncbi:beta keto-acyl synthase [Scytonema hofmannii PCC 7110]|uniref:Beta keto-acyl synthase n=1 Tax=Scytonema hofmannii PCC 7110 TaxID=128403 RepID=A0A139XGE2_9CYAN|nr:type I polyketide synthase [Scytonema hofmannii]KYC43741.1 beta keto-acyl synthase [Scytonema hofmannii PCC 7110]